MRHTDHSGGRHAAQPVHAVLPEQPVQPVLHPADSMQPVQPLGVLFDGADDSPGRGRAGTAALVVVVAALVVTVLVVSVAILRSSDPTPRQQAAPITATSQPTPASPATTGGASSAEPTLDALPALPSLPAATSRRPSTPAHSTARTTAAPSSPGRSGPTAIVPAPIRRPTLHPTTRPHSSPPRPVRPGSVSAARGARYRGTGCSGRCFYLAVELNGFTPGLHLVQCVDADSGVVRSTTTTNATDLPQACWGPRHEALYAVVDGRNRSATVRL